MRVPVHADGGKCHGTPLSGGICPGCGIAPDMQSVELWDPVAQFYRFRTEAAASAAHIAKLKEALGEALDALEGWVTSELEGTKMYQPRMARIAQLRALAVTP